MKKINRLLYHDKYFALFHWVLGLLIMGIICWLIYTSKIIKIQKLTALINSDVISLSATIAGFELAGVTLLISLSGNKKLQDIKDIGSDKTIYKLFFHSIILLTISFLLMLIDINVLKTVSAPYINAKNALGYFSVVLFGQGILFFLSSVRMLMLIFK